PPFGSQAMRRNECFFRRGATEKANAPAGKSRHGAFGRHSDVYTLSAPSARKRNAVDHWSSACPGAGPGRRPNRAHERSTHGPVAIIVAVVVSFVVVVVATVVDHDARDSAVERREERGPTKAVSVWIDAVAV